MPADPHANAGYLVAAYVVTGLILGGYALRLWWRAARELRTDRSRS